MILFHDIRKQGFLLYFFVLDFLCIIVSDLLYSFRVIGVVLSSVVYLKKENKCKFIVLDLFFA